jgi:hypothetical protein
MSEQEMGENNREHIPFSANAQRHIELTLANVEMMAVTIREMAQAIVRMDMEITENFEYVYDRISDLETQTRAIKLAVDRQTRIVVQLRDSLRNIFRLMRDEEITGMSNVRHAAETVTGGTDDRDEEESEETVVDSRLTIEPEDLE